MSHRGLLSRLESGEREQDPVRSIVGNLQVLLNARVGSSLSAPEFGVIAFTDLVHELPHGLRSLQQAIRDSIARYEPRLKNVSVRFVPGEDPLQLGFEVVARVGDTKRSLLRLHTRLTADRQFRFE